MRKAHYLLTATLITSPCVPKAIALECGPPLQQFTRNVDAHGQAQAQGLLKKLFDASAEGKVSIIAQDLISKYPNADKTAIALGLESMYCQIISNSNAPDNEKMEMVTKANAELLKWANGCSH